MDDASFCWGFLAGFVVAGIAGFAFQRIRLASIRTKAANTKQPIRGQTDLTPAEVMRKAWGARLEMIVWVVVILLVIACFAFVLFQGI